MYGLPEMTIYVLLTRHALKRATNKDRLNLPKDPDTICQFLNSYVNTGYLGSGDGEFIFDSPHPPVKAYLHPADDIGPDSYVATTLIRREGDEEFLLIDGLPVSVIWDVGYIRSFRRAKRRELAAA